MAKKKEMCSLENHESGAGIVLMKLEELHSFEGHPFKVERNQELFESQEGTFPDACIVTCLTTALKGDKM